MACNYDKIQKYNAVNESKEYLYIKKMKRLIDIYDRETKNKKQLLIEINSYKEGI